METMATFSYSNKSLRVKKHTTQEDDSEMCVVQNGSFPILKASANGNIQEFKQFLQSNPSTLLARDANGRGVAHLACLNNHVQILKSMLKFPECLEELDQDGNSPLHIAVSSEAVDCIDFLMKHATSTSRVLNKKNQSALHLGAEIGRAASLKAMAKHFGKGLLDADQSGDRGRTALHLACMYNHSECVKILVEEMHASPRRACSLSFLPIHEAAKHGSLNALAQLLQSAAKCGCPMDEIINFPDNDGNSALHFAVQCGNREIVRLCLESGSKISAVQKDASTAVHLACVQGSTDIVKLMFELQPEEKARSLNSCDFERRTPLHYAAMFDHSELVAFLVNQGSDIDPLDRSNCTPLHLAASKHASKTIKCLIVIGADTKIQDGHGRTALHTMAKYNADLSKILDEEIVPQFMPILEAQDNNGNTALQIATKNGSTNSARKLLSMGSNIMLSNEEGDNVLHIACRFGRTKIIQLIVDHLYFSAVLNDTNNCGWTPVHAAAYQGHVEALQVLMKKGLFLHKGHDGRTPLHLAAANGHKKVVSLILRTYPQLLNSADNNGNTPLHCAAMNNQAIVAELLLRHNCRITYNKDGYSAIDVALMNKFVEVSYAMVTHKTRGDEVLGLSKGKNTCIMEALISKLPVVAKAVLDSGIKYSTTEKPDSRKYRVEYDFKWLDKPKDSTGKKGTTSYLPILNDMVNYGRVSLLSHELSLKYMEMKWKTYGKYIRFSSLIVYLIYLLIVTSVSTSEIERDFKFYVRFQWFNESDEVCRLKNESCPMPTYVGRGPKELEAFRAYRKATHNYEWRKFEYAKIWTMAVIAGLSLLIELISVCRHGVKYCKTIDTGVWIAMNISCLIANFFQITARLFKENTAHVSYALVNPSLANAVFMGWLYLFIMMRRFDTVGLYVSMFLEILKTLLRVLFVFSALIIAFTLTFFVLLSDGNHVVFSTFQLSFVRTFTMMLGDLDFMNSLFFPYHCDDMEKNNRTDSRMYASMGECKYSRRVPHPFATFTMICVFLIFIPIVMINLLIGLAVGDIAMVKKNAQLKRLSMQVQNHTNIEKFLPACVLRRVNKTLIVEYPNMKKNSGIIYKLGNYFRRERNQDAREDTPTNLDSIVKRVDKLSSDVADMKTMLSLLCSRLNIQTDAMEEEGTDGTLA